jgi:hypothetical protein
MWTEKNRSKGKYAMDEKEINNKIEKKNLELTSYN